MVKVLLKHRGVVRPMGVGVSHHLITDNNFISDTDPKSPVAPANTFVGITSPAPTPTLSTSFEKTGGMLLNKIKFNKKRSLGETIPSKENTARIKFIF